MCNLHTFRGKWSQPNVPHKGWSCDHMDDLGEQSELCEMCESVSIRYVHYMYHPEYDGILGVGCICAENMEEDKVGPRRREDAFKNSARRKSNWRKQKWRPSKFGDEYINFRGFNILLIKSEDIVSDFWRVRIMNRKSMAQRVGNRKFRSLSEAREAAFSELIWAEENLK